MNIKEKIKQISKIKELIDNLRNSKYIDSELYNINNSLTSEVVLEIFNVYPHLDIFSKEILMNKIIFTDEILLKFVNTHKTNIRYINKYRHTLKLYDLIVETEFGLSQLKIPLNLELFNKINIKKISDIFINMEIKKVKDFLNSLYQYNGYAELEGSYCFWKNIKNINEFKYKNNIGFVNSYDTEEKKEVLKELLFQNKLIEDFYIKLIKFDRINVKFLTNQFTNKLRDEIEIHYFNIEMPILQNISELFKIIPINYKTEKMIEVAVEQDISLFLYTNPKKIKFEIFQNILERLKVMNYNKLNKIYNEKTYDEVDKIKIAIFHLLKNDEFKTQEVFDIIEKIEFTFFVKCAIHMPQKFFTQKQTKELLLEDLWDLSYHILNDNDKINELLTEDTIKSLLTKYNKKTIKNSLKDYLPENILYLLEIDVNEFHKSQIREFVYNFFDIPFKLQTLELFQFFKDQCKIENYDYNSLIKNNIKKININFIESKDLTELIFRNNLDLFSFIVEKNPDLLNDLNLNKNMAKKEIFWKFINKDFINNEQLLFNLLEPSKNDIDKIINYFIK